MAVLSLQVAFHISVRKCLRAMWLLPVHISVAESVYFNNDLLNWFLQQFLTWIAQVNDCWKAFVIFSIIRVPLRSAVSFFLTVSLCVPSFWQSKNVSYAGQAA